MISDLADSDVIDAGLEGRSGDSDTRSVFSLLAVLLLHTSVIVLVPLEAGSLPLTRVAAGLNRPVYLTAPASDFDRVFILEQHTGRIKILDLSTGIINATPFLTVTGISTGSEQGLLGLAFHPDYATNGSFHVYITDTAGDTRVLRYEVSADPNLADVGSQTSVLEIAQPQSNHNGGWIGFGPDDFLYIATGDGGAGNDSGTGHTPGTGNAQDLTSLLGKLLRIDVDGDDFPMDPDRNYSIPSSNPFVGMAGRDEIWAFGLRNPWRPSFDRLIGDLYIADVGQNNCEEVDIELVGSSGGENYGWRLREGTVATPTGAVGGAKPAGAIDPLIDYSHNGTSVCSNPPSGLSGFSITGGYVYRGPGALLQGRYFFADFVQDQLWTLTWDGSNPSTHDGTNFVDLAQLSMEPDVGQVDSIASFGEDSTGRLYIVDLGGEIFRVVPEPDSAARTIGLLMSVALLAYLGRRRTSFRDASPITSN